MKKLIPLLHPKRQPGSEKIWNDSKISGAVPIMMVDGATRKELLKFNSMIEKALEKDDNITHLSIHTTKNEQWDWTDSKLSLGEIGEWILLKDKEAVTL
jgi:hypothetical protein